MTETEKQLKKLYSTGPTAIEEMYTANLQNQKAGLEADHAAANAALIANQKKQQQATDAALTRTAVEGQQAIMNNAQLNAAYGLSSGAAAQARISQENQTSANMAALRAAQLEADAGIEEQRALLGQQLASAIRQAQSENDMEKAKALYDYAQQEEKRLNEERLSAAQLMSQAGDFSLMGEIYGLTPQQVAKLNNAAAAATSTSTANTAYERELEAAKIMAEAGDYTRLGKLHGLSQAEIDKLNGVKPVTDDNTGGNPIISQSNALGDNLPEPTIYSAVEQNVAHARKQGWSRQDMEKWLTALMTSKDYDIAPINETQKQFLLAKYF